VRSYLSFIKMLQSEYIILLIVAVDGTLDEVSYLLRYFSRIEDLLQKKRKYLNLAHGSAVDVS